MNFSQYQLLAMRTAKAMETKKMDLMHAGLGMISETGELATMTKAHIFYGKPFDRTNAMEEMGDTMWFSALAAKSLDDDLGNIVAQAEMQSYQHHPAFGVCKPNAGTMAMDFLFCVSEMAHAAGRAHAAIYPSVFGNLELKKNNVKDDIKRTILAVARGALVLSIDLEAIAIFNITKLSKRYPDKYSDQAAIARADKGEQA